MEAVLITGNGHSGTSLCSNIISESGYPIPSRFIDRNYEIKKVLRINERQDNTTQIKNFVTEAFKKYEPKISLKDPRFARTGSIIKWSDIISQLGGKSKWIFCFRHPSPCINSLREKHHHQTSLLWWSKGAEFALSHAEKFLFLDYDLNETDSNVLCLQKYLELPVTPKNLYDISKHNFKTKENISSTKRYPALESLYLEMVKKQQKFMDTL